MQRTKIKAGQFYAYTDGTKKYGQRFRIKVLELDHEFHLQKRVSWDRTVPLEDYTERDILAVKVDEINDEPLVTHYRSQREPHIAQPFRLTDVKRVLSTWDEELAERGTNKEQAAKDAAERQANREKAEASRADFLSLLGEHGGDEAEKIRIARVETTFGQTSAHLDLGHIGNERLLRLLNAAYQAGRAAGASTADERSAS